MLNIRVHQDYPNAPAYTDDVDRIAPSSEVEMRARRENASATAENDNDRCYIADLEGDASSADDGLKRKVAAKDDETNDEINDDYRKHCAQWNAETLVDDGQILRERKCTVTGHAPCQA